MFKVYSLLKDLPYKIQKHSVSIYLFYFSVFQDSWGMSDGAGNVELTL